MISYLSLDRCRFFTGDKNIFSDRVISNFLVVIQKYIYKILRPNFIAQPFSIFMHSRTK